MEAEKRRQFRLQTFPFTRAGPARGHGLLIVFQTQGAAVVFQLAHLLAPELPLAAEFAALLFRHAGHADGRQFLALAVNVAGQAQAKLARIQRVGLPVTHNRNRIRAHTDCATAL